MMTSTVRTAWFVGLWTMMFWIGSIGVTASQESALAPRQVVANWLQLYPGKMAQAAEMTTTGFREGRSKEEWIATQGTFLKDLGMKYVRAKIVHEELAEKEAHVIVHAHIFTVMGDHPQDELYILVPDPEGGWLIDQVEVYTESFNRVP